MSVFRKTIYAIDHIYGNRKNMQLVHLICTWLQEVKALDFSHSGDHSLDTVVHRTIRPRCTPSSFYENNILTSGRGLHPNPGFGQGQNH